MLKSMPTICIYAVLLVFMLTTEGGAYPRSFALGKEWVNEMIPLEERRKEERREERKRGRKRVGERGK